MSYAHLRIFSSQVNIPFRRRSIHNYHTDLSTRWSVPPLTFLHANKPKTQDTHFLLIVTAQKFLFTHSYLPITTIKPKLHTFMHFFRLRIFFVRLQSTFFKFFFVGFYEDSYSFLVDFNFNFFRGNSIVLPPLCI